jgi:hypothetical protein
MKPTLGVLMRASLVLLLAGCGSDKQTLTDPAPDPLVFSYGTPHTLSIAAANGGTVAENTVGGTLIFPQGGNGTLTVTPITNGPDLPRRSGQGFRLQGLGETPITLKLPAPAAGKELTLHIYAPAQGCYDGGPRPTMAWILLKPTSQTDTFVYYTLPRTIVAAAEAARGRQIANNDLFFRSVGDPPANANLIRSDVTLAIVAMLGSLPDADYDRVNANIQAHPLLLDWRDNTLCTYSFPFGWYVGSGGPSTLNLRDDLKIGDMVIYHEVGHYMTHMVMTNDQWWSLQKSAPSKEHTPGEVYTRDSVLIEDYAYYMQFMAEKLDGLMTPPTGLANKWLPPSTEDWPSREGYAAVLMSCLTDRAKANMVDWANKKSTIPLVGATPGEVAMLLRECPFSLNALLPRLQALALAKGKTAEEFAVVAERTGWSYTGKGNVKVVGPADGRVAIDATGAKVKVESVVKVDNNGVKTEYTTETTSDAKGDYTIRLFPGKQTLRFTYGDLVKEVPIADIAWSRATTSEMTLGPVELVLNFNLSGWAAPLGSTGVQLIPDAYNANGSWVSANKLPLADGFDESYTFEYTSSKSPDQWADGIQNALDINNAPVSIDLDIYQNSWDPNGSHADIRVAGTETAVSVSLKDGKSHRVRMVYTQGVVLIYFDGNQIFTKAVDLKTVFPNGNAKIGLLGRSYSLSCAHKILSWSLKLTPSP